LTSDFFLDNKRFLGKVALKPDPALRAAFFAANERALDLARLRLNTNPADPNALFSMTLTLGMQADYASLIDKQQIQSLKMTGEADKYAKKLLAVAPEAADAYLVLGVANYVIGSLPAHKRFLLGFAGIHGDKRVGMQQLEIAATSGHYLRPFAKILLALAALREKKTGVACAQLTELVAEFPENPLFASELAKLSVPGQGRTDQNRCVVEWSLDLRISSWIAILRGENEWKQSPKTIQQGRSPCFSLFTHHARSIEFSRDRLALM
jgi:hypothetical protein